MASLESRALGGLGPQVGCVVLLHHGFSDGSALIKVLLRQSQFLVVQATGALIVPAAIREEGPNERGHGCTHSRSHGVLRRLHRLHAPLIALLAGFGFNGPLRVRVSRDALPALEHVPLADEETGDNERLVAPVVHRRAVVISILGKLLQAEKSGDGTGTLLPGGEIDLGRAIVVQGELLVGEVEAEPQWPHGEAVFVPHAADHGGPGAANTLNLGQHALGVSTERILVDECVIRVVQAEDIRHDPWHAGFGGRLDDLGMEIRRSSDANSDDEKLLALESGDESRFIVVVDGNRLDAGWNLVPAAAARESSDDMPTGPEEGLSNVRANLAARLCH